MLRSFYALVTGLDLQANDLQEAESWTATSFYALVVGLGFASSIREISASSSGFYALGIGLGFATRTRARHQLVPAGVSMPSVSGWALRPGP
jgi:hypothetical protein